MAGLAANGEPLVSMKASLLTTRSERAVMLTERLMMRVRRPGALNRMWHKKYGSSAVLRWAVSPLNTLSSSRKMDYVSNRRTNHSFVSFFTFLFFFFDTLFHSEASI